MNPVAYPSMPAVAPAPLYPAAFRPRYASFGKRAIAFLLDGMLLGVLNTALVSALFLSAAVLGFAAADEAGFLFFVFGVLPLVAPLVLLTSIVYHVRSESGPFQGTFGKRLMGLRVVTLEGRTISSGQSLARFLALSLLGGWFFWLPLFTSARQGLHDLAAGTIVVEPY
jgi:uncharacterized RDD family membrane protein YckC